MRVVDNGTLKIVEHEDEHFMRIVADEIEQQTMEQGKPCKQLWFANRMIFGVQQCWISCGMEQQVELEAAYQKELLK